jgi:hypothetical protein
VLYQAEPLPEFCVLDCRAETEAEEILRLRYFSKCIRREIKSGWLRSGYADSPGAGKFSGV